MRGYAGTDVWPAAVRSVLLLCWRDTGHPQGGGSEAYLQRIGAQLAESGVDVTLRTARYAGAPRREVVDGVQINRAGGRLFDLHLGGLGDGAGPHRARSAAQSAARRRDRHPERTSRSWRAWRTVAASSFWCTTATANCGPLPAAGPGASAGSSSRGCRRRLHRRNQYVTVSLPSARDLTDLGVDAAHIAVVRNGLDEAPPETLDAASLGPPARRSAEPAGAAQADRRRARRRRQAAAPDSGPAPRHRRRRLVAPSAW